MYFDPPPAVHPEVPDPNKIEVDHDASREEKAAAGVVRAVLSAAHGLKDAEHYFLRLFITFFLLVAVILVALAVAVEVGNI